MGFPLRLMQSPLLTHYITKPPEANTATYAPPLPQSIKSLPLYTLPRSSHFPQISSCNILPLFSSHWGRRPTFLLTLDGWMKRTILGNLPSFIRRTSPSHLILSCIIAIESGIETHFSNSLLFKIRSVSRVPRAIRRQFLLKTSIKSFSDFRAPTLQNQT
jgi:hypothetical protein